MAFIDDLLQAPSYGWKDGKGLLIRPSSTQLWRAAFRRINLFQSKKNWIAFSSVAIIVCLLPALYLFLFRHFSRTLLVAFVIYGMVIMGTHGTIWFHRYCTHKTFRFSHPLWRILTQNLVIRTLPEEVYVVSHHVHHSKSDEPGDPYNAQAGFLYCMLVEFNNERVSPGLSEG